MLPKDFVETLEFVHPKKLSEELYSKRWPGEITTLELRNEVRPSDIYCYLGGRFGAPNGFQNFLRANHSDNIIHWEWVLRHSRGFISFQGHNFRTEIHIFADGPFDDAASEIAAQLKRDFGTHGHEMKKIRDQLESWVEFVNPYQRIKRAVDQLSEELELLELHEIEIEDAWSILDSSKPLEEARAEWGEMALRYSKGFGLAFGIRSLLPILAESFVNLLMYILLRPQVKNDFRLYETAFRQPIDVRIKSLPINCVGFEKTPDYSDDVLKAYHSLVNERNDLLHGNVVIDKLKFNEVFFNGTVPVFKEYRSMWDRSLGVEMNAVGLDRVDSERKVVRDLCDYLLSCLDETKREGVTRLTEERELGLNTDSKILGVLFPNWLVDFRARKSKQSLTENDQQVTIGDSRRSDDKGD